MLGRGWTVGSPGKIGKSMLQVMEQKPAILEVGDEFVGFFVAEGMCYFQCWIVVFYGINNLNGLCF